MRSIYVYVDFPIHGEGEERCFISKCCITSLAGLSWEKKAKFGSRMEKTRESRPLWLGKSVVNSDLMAMGVSLAGPSPWGRL